MIKSELIHRLANKQQNLSLEDIEASINHTLEHLCDALGNGTRIEIRGFGSFSLHYRPERNARNPKTGEKLIKTAKYWPHFKAGNELKKRLNPVVEEKG